MQGQVTDLDSASTRLLGLGLLPIHLHTCHQSPPLHRWPVAFCSTQTRAKLSQYLAV